MNNFKQKNVIYGIDDANILPYAEGSVGIQGSYNVKSPRMNGIFGNLVANDLYIENTLKRNGYRIGPKSLTDEEIKMSPDGTKIYNVSDSEFQINKKIDSGIIETGNLVSTNVNERVNFLKKFGKYMICGTEYGLKYSTDGNVFYDFEDIPFVDAVVSNDKMFMVSKDCVYELVVWNELDIPFKLYRINENYIDKAKCVHFGQYTNFIYVGTENGKVMKGTYLSRNSRISFQSMGNFLDCDYNAHETGQMDVGNVVDIMQMDYQDNYGNRIKSITDDNSLIVSTDAGIYRNKYENNLGDLNKKIFNDKIVGIASLNGTTLIATKRQLIKSVNGGEYELLETGKDFVGLKMARDGKVYAILKKSIWRFDINLETHEEILKKDETYQHSFTDMDVMTGLDNTILVTTESGIIPICGENELPPIMEDRKISKICIPNATGAKCAYIKTEEKYLNFLYNMSVEGQNLIYEERKISIVRNNTLVDIVQNDNDSLNIYCIFKNTDGRFTFNRYEYNIQMDPQYTELQYFHGKEHILGFSSIVPLNGNYDQQCILVTIGGEKRLLVSSGSALKYLPESIIEKDDALNISFYRNDGTVSYVTIDNVVYRFKSETSQSIFKRISDDKYMSNKITRIENNSFLIGTELGIYAAKYSRDQMTFPYPVTTSEETNDVFRIIRTEEMTNVPKYLALAGEYVLRGDDYRSMERFMHIGRCYIGTRTTASDIIPQDGYHYCIGSECGAYNTSYNYTLSNDFYVFDEKKFNELYDSMKSRIQSNIDYSINHDHTLQYHGSDSLVTKVNKKMRTDFSNLSSDGNWPLTREADYLSSVYNDYVKDVSFGQYGDGKIRVTSNNFLMSSDTIQFQYIVKKWSSGLTELYVYVPTTNTYYLPHNLGTPNCSVYSREILRKNLVQFGTDAATTDGDVNSHCTKFTVELDNSEFEISKLIEVQSNGNSLPLKIYKDYDQSDADGEQSKMFHSFILPTVLVQRNINNQTEGESEIEQYHKFKFACFGTDSQAVKIQFYDKTAFSKPPVFFVVFNANGGTGTMDKQVIPYDENKTRRLKTNAFTQKDSSKAFLGWSYYQNPSRKTDTYVSDGAYIGLVYLPQDIRNTLREGGTLNLYAVWGEYDLDGASEFTLESTKEDFYIDSVTIDTNTKYGENVVINYGD